MKRILIGTMAVMMAVPCFAAGENVLTSKPYVDDAVSTRQDKIPAANPSNTNLGETVMTYTDAGDGEIGERELFTGGTYNATNDADKLITASALKSAFTLPETQTTKLVCANQSEGCTLWTITNQTAYGRIDLMSLIGNVGGIDGGAMYSNGRGYNQSTYGLSQSGTFVVDYRDGKRISGKAQCSTRPGDVHTRDNDTYNTIPNNFTPTLSDASGQYCYCQLDGYTTTGANWGAMESLSTPWMFIGDILALYNDDCESVCANECEYGLRFDFPMPLALRAALFNSVQ